MFVSRVTDEFTSLDMPQALVDLLIENSFDRVRLLKMSIDDLAQISSSTKFGETFDRIVKQKIALDHPMVETSENKKCNSCGTENRGTARYCDNCGLSFQG